MGWNSLHWAAFKGDTEAIKDIIAFRKKNLGTNDIQKSNLELLLI